MVGVRGRREGWDEEKQKGNNQRRDSGGKQRNCCTRKKGIEKATTRQWEGKDLVHFPVRTKILKNLSSQITMWGFIHVSKSLQGDGTGGRRAWGRRVFNITILEDRQIGFMPELDVFS